MCVNVRKGINPTCPNQISKQYKFLVDFTVLDSESHDTSEAHGAHYDIMFIGLVRPHESRIFYIQRHLGQRFLQSIYMKKVLLDLANTSRVDNILGLLGRRRRGNVAQARELVEGTRVLAVEVTRVGERVHLAVAAENTGAGRGGRRVDDAVQLTSPRRARVLGGVDAREDAALNQDVATLANLEAMRRVLPVVVDGVEDRVAAHLGGTARDVVDVVVLEGDLVVGALVSSVALSLVREKYRIASDALTVK